MNRIIKVISLLTTVCMLITLIGCKDSYQEAIIYFEIPEKPYTLDPQTASTDSELSVVSNIFEGLFRKNESGAIVCGACESFEYNNLTYTFKLRKDIVWSNEEPLTASDFVFGLKRAVSNETKAPFAARLFPIVNAEKIYNGKAPVDTLGVSAPDDSTLIIKISYEDEAFEEALASSVAMPCNEKFFNTSGGRYGLSKEYILSCGSYKLTKWVKDDKSFGMRLYSNNFYSGSFKAKNYAVYITKKTDEAAIDRLLGNNVDIAFIDSSISKTAVDGGLKTVDYQNICWVMTFNSDFSESMRKSLMMLVGSEVYSDNLKAGYTFASSLFPSAVCNNPPTAGVVRYNLTEGKQIFSSEVSRLDGKKFPEGIKLYYYDNGVIKPIITDIVGHWQNNLGAFVNIEAVDNVERLTCELKKQALSVAVFPIRADSESISEYLANFGIDYNGEPLDTVQTRLLKNRHIIPIAFQNTTIAYSSALNDVFTELGNGYIDFSFIVKTE